MNNYSPTINRSGFTLIEIIALMVVAAIILPAIILPFVVGVQDFHLPVIRGTLAFLAQEEMETEIISRDYDEINSWTATGIPGFPGYSSSCVVNEVETGRSEVTLTVSRGGESVTLVTIRTDWN
ncbi:MAG: hypothetical protein P9M08_00470 [Candidatus Erginobacter occultus]|nr:hypothetical protein [Candidatus Erginobacter occultus]